MTEWEEAEELDEAVAKGYVGKYLLIGLTILDSNGNIVDQLQMHGVVERADRTGITVSNFGYRRGDEYIHPPDLRAIEPAPAAVYRLNSTGESIDNPELLSSWTVKRPTAN